MKHLTHNALTYYQFEGLSQLKHGIFTRKGGMSTGQWAALNVGGTVGDDPEAVWQNHVLMYDALQVNAVRSCTTWLVHSADVVVVDGPRTDRRWIERADGMLTDKPDTPLVMRYADCTPVLFHDPTRGIIGIAHAGWRGTVMGMCANMVTKMVQQFGSKPADIYAAIGPAIGHERYQVGEEVVEAVQRYFGTTNGGMPEGALIRRDPDDGTAYFNLWAANRLDLERAGVEQIEVAGICTASHTGEFFSHRAEQGRTGRFGVVISL